jgi:hypothetical protein
MRRVALVLALTFAIPAVGGCEYSTESGSRPNGASASCEPSYPDDCLDPDALDYDCEGGEGDGPEYVAGPVTVRGDDPFDLDRDGDGIGCDSY